MDTYFDVLGTSRAEYIHCIHRIFLYFDLEIGMYVDVMEEEALRMNVS
jgi:hypothetical protein